MKPICLPYEDDPDEDYHTNEAMQQHLFWVAGWGATTRRGNFDEYLLSLGNVTKNKLSYVNMAMHVIEFFLLLL